jgi:hypothetical protein
MGRKLLAHALQIALIALFLPAIVVLNAWPAWACAGHQNEEAQDEGTATANGNRGDVLVNNIDYGALRDGIFKSLFIWHGDINDVEVGWSGHANGFTQPTLYLEWKKDGADSSPQYYNYLMEGVFYNLRIQDSDKNGIFSAYVDSGSSFDTTINMGWSTGRPLTNSERYNSCDGGYAHFKSLHFCQATPCTWQTYRNLECWPVTDGMGNYWVDIVSNSEHYVDLGTGC